MFKKLKDKLAEEVKSSPQRIQQFAQAAQAAVTSASSSISDITNNDLFSIGDNDTQKTATSKHSTSQQGERDTFQDVSLSSPSMSSDLVHAEAADFSLPATEHQRQRRLSNSSFASDVSFKLPTYESPSMYHLQSDMDVSASEAEERLAGAGLQRVTKEQVYAAYRRTQARYDKYRARYTELARHYKTLERENAKARSVLVETQDKALRRISELREQCTLEQSAKAHLERSLRLEIDEKSMKLEALTTKLNYMQNDIPHEPVNQMETNKVVQGDAQLIDLSADKDDNKPSESLPESLPIEITALNNKIEKMGQLISKYKESLKNMKEKNTLLTSELTIKNVELENKTKEIEQLSLTTIHLTEAREKIQELKELSEELQNKVNSYEFSKSKEETVLQLDLQKALDEIAQLQTKICTLSKREEEYAFSLAENKLSIHKELESKESEIKSLKFNLDASVKEVQSLNIVINEYKTKTAAMEAECSKLRNDLSEYSTVQKCLEEKQAEIGEISKKYTYIEQQITKKTEEYNCLELQFKQETAEKLALLDRNEYLGNRNKQALDDISKKDQYTLKLEKELQEEKSKLVEKEGQSHNEAAFWKDKSQSLEAEIHEEREELIKLQTEIEKLLKNYELVQNENSDLHERISQLNLEYKLIEETLNDCKSDNNSIKIKLMEILPRLKEVKEFVPAIRNDVQTLNNFKGDLEKMVNNTLTLIHRFNQENKENVHMEDNEKNQENYQICLKQIETLVQQKNDLETRIDQVDLERTKYFNLSQETENKWKAVEIESENLKHVKNEIETRFSEIESKYANSENELNAYKSRYDTLNNEFSAFKSEKSEHTQLLELKYKASLGDLEIKNETLQHTIEDLKEKLDNSDDLSEKLKSYVLENASLRRDFDIVSKNVNDLKESLEKVRNSHDALEREKEKLTLFIKELEDSIETQKNQNIEENNKSIQLLSEENNVLKIKCEQIKQEKEELFEKQLTLEQLCSEREKIVIQNNELSKECSLLRSQFSELNDYHEKLKEEIEIFKNDSEMHSEERRRLEDNYADLKKEFYQMKDENKRLQSDIEGLQTYLTKISKENSTLNDQLREMIATSENPDNKDNSMLLEEKEKYNELLRQNTLLEEENLELKDQLQAQNYAPPIAAKVEVKSESTVNDDNSKTRIALETKLADVEYMNKTINGSLAQEQEQNKKLRLNNEKLERRLDEALVSLRHLHSLQENTELEYLRNVLFEYLTGSGAHSVTLAKVLAAVVKFDDHQTHQILTKEKERQGVLRQLGLL